MFCLFKNAVLSRVEKKLSTLESNYEKTIVLNCRKLAESNRQRLHINNLSDVEFRGFSQWGEDGIIDWLVSKIECVPKKFIEFGVGNYKESNTRLLLSLRNWKGLIIDGSEENIKNIQEQDIYWRYELNAVPAFVNTENINDIISSANLTGEIGILSIDIDGNDYWLWMAINVVRPVIVICEYNAIFGDLHKISVPYDKKFQRSIAHYSNLYFGASLPALIDLGASKGYTFVGTNSNGCNAFFVRSDLSHIVLKSLAEPKSFCSSFREERNLEGKLIYTNGKNRIKSILNLGVFDFTLESVKCLKEYDEIFSANWTK